MKICPTCKGNGKTLEGDGGFYMCPECKGVGHVHEKDEEKIEGEGVCNGCGFRGTMEATLSAYSWGRCPSCKTTNVEALCDECKTIMEDGAFGSKRCLKCDPKGDEAVASK